MLDTKPCGLWLLKTIEAGIKGIKDINSDSVSESMETWKHGNTGIIGISQLFSGIKENTASNCNEQRACAAIHQLHLCLLSDVEVAVCQ